MPGVRPSTRIVALAAGVLAGPMGARRATAADPAQEHAPGEGRRFIQVEETDEGPQPRSEGTRMQLGALVQVLAGGTPDLDPGFRVRRARVALDGQLEPTLRTQIYLEAELAPTPDLVGRPLSEGYVAFDVASRSVANIGRLRMGQTRIGFGRELGLEPQQLPFVDRSLTSRCLGPGAQHVTSTAGTPSLLQAAGRDVGMRWDLHLDLPRRFFGDAVLGAYSGVGPNRVDPTVGPLLVGRAVLGRGRADDRSRLHVTLGGSAARNDGDEIRAGCGALPTLEPGVPTVRWGADLHLRWRALSLDAEGIVLRADRTAQALAPFPLEGRGAFVSAGLFFLADFAEATARWERVQRRAAGPLPAMPPGGSGVESDFDELTLGVNARYYGDRFRLQYNYVQRSRRGAGRGVVDIAHAIAFTVYL